MKLENALARLWLYAVLVVILAFGISTAIPVEAANFNPGCTAGVGDAAALQTAITTAASNGQADTITLVAGCTYTTTATMSYGGDGGTMLTINGNGAAINGGGSRRIFEFFSTNPVVTINNVTITNGGGITAGAIFNAGTVTLNNSTISNHNTTGVSGGVYNTGTMTINATTITGNATPDQAAGIYSSGTLTINNSIISNNTSGGFGGGILNQGTLTVNKTTFTNNAALGTSLGGAIYNGANMLATITASTFTDNSALQGAGIHNAAGTLRVDTSTFTHNIAAEFGGGIRSAGSTGDTRVNTSLFVNNEAGTNGGGYYNSVGIVTLNNSTFTGNTASNGGGVYVLSGIVGLFNVTVSGNTATTSGGGIVRNGNTAELSRTIVAANNAPTAPDISGTITSSGYNLIGNTSGASGMAGTDLTNAAATPLNLGALANNGGPTQTMALLPGSVAIDSGTPGYTPIDFEQRWIGFPRVANGRVDIGAFEVQAACPSFPVSIPNGNSAALIDAIHCANRTAGAQTINLAAGGSYSLTTFQYSSLLGSANGLPAVNDAAASGALTINGNGATVTRGGASDLRLIEVLSGGNLTLNAITLSNGKNTGGFGSAYGGSIYNAGTLAINSSTLSGNQAAFGGGIFNVGVLTFTSSSFLNNVATSFGGALSNAVGGSATISASTLTNNDAGAIGGGGINNDGTLSVTTTTIANSDTTNNNADGAAIRNIGTATISASTLNDNTTLRNGGGIYNAGVLTVTNTTINNNFASNLAFTGRGGGIYTTGTATITHSTISQNLAGDAAGGISGDVTLGNTIVAANVSSSFADIVSTVTSLGYNLIGNSSGSTGLVATDLTDAAASPLNLGGLANNGGPTQTRALLAGSKAINRGNPAFASPPDFDQRGTGFPRVRGGRIDIGAYESENYVVLNVQLTLQGRTAGASPTKVTSNHVQVRPSGGGAPVFVGDYVSNTNGQFSMLELVPGTYNIWIKGVHTLARVQSITLAVGDNNMTTALLLEGDADDSNSVILTDFSLLAASFGKATGQAGFDARADFNQDGAVNLTDFSLLASNFNQAGAP